MSFITVFNKTSIIFLFIASTIQAGFTKDIVAGVTYEILERDAEEELMERVNSTDWEGKLNFDENDSDKWGATQTTYVHLAENTVTRQHIPFYTSEFDVKLPDGRIIYPKGYTFNPLLYARLPNKFYVLTPSTEKYFYGKISSRDQVLYANGNPLKAKKRLKMPVFVLDDKTKERLGIQYSPSIIEQRGGALIIQEISIHELEEGYKESTE